MRYWIKTNKGFLVFMCCFGFLRLAIADYNPIPSGSMRPTLLEGDVVLVNRVAYDFKFPLTDLSLVRIGEPQRGDVITFTSPKNGTRLIKRLVALPGDVVEMRDEVLYLNGVAANYLQITRRVEPLDGGSSTPAIHAKESLLGYEHAVQVLPEVKAMRHFGPLQVPSNHYFFLGDNRNNSADSRYFGMVPRQLLIGKAHHVLVSADIKGAWLPRWDRFFQTIH